MTIEDIYKINTVGITEDFKIKLDLKRPATGAVATYDSFTVAVSVGTIESSSVVVSSDDANDYASAMYVIPLAAFSGSSSLEITVSSTGTSQVITPYTKTTKSYVYEGDSVWHPGTYKPLPNLKKTRGTATEGFNTNKLKIDVSNKIDFLLQDSYDGSVNMIISDSKNPPRIINSRFYVDKEGVGHIADRRGNSDTNQYDEDALTSTRLDASPMDSPEIIGINVKRGGRLACGSYRVLFKYVDQDTNESNIVASSKDIQVYAGDGDSSFFSEEESSGRLISLLLRNNQYSREFYNVYLIHTVGELSLTSKVYKSKVKTKVPEAGPLEYTVRSLDDFEEISFEELVNYKYKIQSVDHMVEHNNRLIVTNPIIESNEVPRDLFDLVMDKVRLSPKRVEVLNLGVGTGTTGIPSDINGIEPTIETTDMIDGIRVRRDPKGMGGFAWRYDNEVPNVAPVDIRSYLADVNFQDASYYPGETYEFRLHFTLEDGNEYLGCPVRGGFFNTLGDIVYTSTEFKDETTFLATGENNMGVIRFPRESLFANRVLYKLALGINQSEIRAAILDYNRLHPEELDVTGYYITRKECIPECLATGVMTGCAPTGTSSSNLQDKTPQFTEKKYGASSSKKPLVPAVFNQLISLSIAAKAESYAIENTIVELTKLTDTNTIAPDTEKATLYVPELAVNPNFVSNLFKNDNFGINKIGEVHYDYETDIKDNGYVLQTAITDIYGSTIGTYSDKAKLAYIPRGLTPMSGGKFASKVLPCLYDSGNTDLNGSSVEFNSYIGVDWPTNTLMTDLYSFNENLGEINLESGRFGANNSDKTALPLVAIYADELGPLTVARWINKYRTVCNDNSNLIPITNKKMFRPTGDLLSEAIALGGDCYVCKVDYKVAGTQGLPSEPLAQTEDAKKYLVKSSEEADFRGISLINYGIGLQFYSLSRQNCNVRAEEDGSPTEKAMYGGSRRSFYPKGIDSMANGTRPTSNKGDLSIGAFSNFTISVSEDFRVPAVDKVHPTRVMASNIYSTSSFQNGYRRFEALNYHDFTSKYGNLIKLENIGGKVVGLFESGITILPIDEKTLLNQSGNTADIIIGQGELFGSVLSVITEEVGITDKRHSIVAENNLFVYSTNRLYSYSANGFIELSNLRLRKKLKDLGADGYSVVLNKDTKLNLLYVTFYPNDNNKRLQGLNASKTLVYNYAKDTFESIMDIPYYIVEDMLEGGGKIQLSVPIPGYFRGSTDMNQIYAEGAGVLGRYFKEDFINHTIEFVVSSDSPSISKILQNLRIVSEREYPSLIEYKALDKFGVENEDWHIQQPKPRRKYPVRMADSHYENNTIRVQVLPKGVQGVLTDITGPEIERVTREILLQQLETTRLEKILVSINRSLAIVTLERDQVQADWINTPAGSIKDMLAAQLDDLNADINGLEGLKTETELELQANSDRIGRLTEYLDSLKEKKIRTKKLPLSGNYFKVRLTYESSDVNQIHIKGVSSSLLAENPI